MRELGAGSALPPQLLEGCDYLRSKRPCDIRRAVRRINEIDQDLELALAWRRQVEHLRTRLAKWPYWRLALLKFGYPTAWASAVAVMVYAGAWKCARSIAACFGAPSAIARAKTGASLSVLGTWSVVIVSSARDSFCA